MLDNDSVIDRRDSLAALRTVVARLEHGGATIPSGTISLCQSIDKVLPGTGLQRGAVHEVLAADPGAAAAFCALVLARAGGPVAWIAPEPDLWPAGIRDFGLSQADLILIRAKRPKDRRWAFEEVLRSDSVKGAALMWDGPPPDLIAGRRLQLAAERGGSIGLLMMPDTTLVLPSAARTRWRVGSAPSRRSADPCWQLALLRATGGRPAAWTVSWDRAAQALMVTRRPKRGDTPAYRTVP
jgi:protein ImuA